MTSTMDLRDRVAALMTEARSDLAELVSIPSVADARHPPVRPVDMVLLDAPCLGTGTFARHPDARWRVSPEALTTLAQRQAELHVVVQLTTSGLSIRGGSADAR